MTHYISIQTRAGAGEPGGEKVSSSPSLEMLYSSIPLPGLVIILNHYRAWSPNF